MTLPELGDHFPTRDAFHTAVKAYLTSFGFSCWIRSSPKLDAARPKITLSCSRTQGCGFVIAATRLALPTDTAAGHDAYVDGQYEEAGRKKFWWEVTMLGPEHVHGRGGDRKTIVLPGTAGVALKKEESAVEGLGQAGTRKGARPRRSAGRVAEAEVVKPKLQER